MSLLYALWGEQSRSWITRGGRVIAHHDRGEMEWLFPGATVRPLRGVAEGDLLMARDMPEFAGVTWPLRKDQFRE